MQESALGVLARRLTDHPLDGGYYARFVSNNPSSGYTVYDVEVRAPDGACWVFQTRYSEVQALHERLWLSGYALPSMPGKRLFGNQDPMFLARRMAELQHVLDGALMLDPQVQHPALRNFVTGGLDYRGGGCSSTSFGGSAVQPYAAVRAESARPRFRLGGSSVPSASSFVSGSSSSAGVWTSVADDRTARSETPGPRRRWGMRREAGEDAETAGVVRNEARRRWPSALPSSRGAPEVAERAVVPIAVAAAPTPEKAARLEAESEMPHQQKQQRKQRSSYPSAIPPKHDSSNILVADASPHPYEFLTGGDPRPPSGRTWDWPLSRCETKARVVLLERRMASLHIDEIEARAEARCGARHGGGGGV